MTTCSQSCLCSTSMITTAGDIVRQLQQAGFSTYFVGGCVRDLLLGKAPKDIDIVTNATPDQVEKLFPHSHMIGASFGVVTVVKNCFTYEVATFREEREYNDGRHPERVLYTDNPELDAQRRDFSINGLFYDPVTDKILDYVGGLEDIKRGLVRTIGQAELRFAEDYLRMLRAVRFCVRYRFTLDDDIKMTVPELAANVKKLSAERIRDELNKMLLGPNPSRAITLLSELKLLEEFFPELEALKGVEQPPKHHPEGDVFTHVMIMLEMMAYPNIELAWSILLHDIAKPDTFSIEDDGEIHFYGHEAKSAEFAEKIMVRFRMPKNTIKAVVQAVSNHMRFAHVQQMRAAKLKRLIAEPTFPLELELHRVDCMGCHCKVDNVIFLLDKLREVPPSRDIPEPLITGNDLIDLGLNPGPIFREILDKVTDLQLENQLTNHEDAVAYVKKNYCE